MFKNRGVRFIGVNVPSDTEGSARAFVADRKIPYAIGHDEGGIITGLYGVRRTPTTFIVSADGNVAVIARGKVGLEQLTAVLEQLADKK